MAFVPTRSTPVSGERNEGINFGNVTAKPGAGGGRYHGGSGGLLRNIERWSCGGDHMKRD